VAKSGLVVGELGFYRWLVGDIIKEVVDEKYS